MRARPWSLFGGALALRNTQGQRQAQRSHVAALEAFRARKRAGHRAADDDAQVHDRALAVVGVLALAVIGGFTGVALADGGALARPGACRGVAHETVRAIAVGRAQRGAIADAAPAIATRRVRHVVAHGRRHLARIAARARATKDARAQSGVDVCGSGVGLLVRIAVVAHAHAALPGLVFAARHAALALQDQAVVTGAARVRAQVLVRSTAVVGIVNARRR